MSSPNINISEPVKRPRGRPKKYSEEEQKEKHKIAVRKWKDEHQDEYRADQRSKYRENREDIIQQKMIYQKKARDALRLLAEIVEQDALQDDRFKTLSIELIRHNKFIYT